MIPNTVNIISKTNWYHASIKGVIQSCNIYLLILNPM